MKIFTAEQMRAWDAYSIEQEPISSIDLMERAANACVAWMLNRFRDNEAFSVFCGKGNNGGDGLAISRLLHSKGRKATVYVLESAGSGSEDFQQNLQRLQDSGVEVLFLKDESALINLPAGTVIVDALFGTGLNKPLAGTAATLIEHLNGLANTCISIDIPSGLFADRSSRDLPVMRADHTLTFSAPKLALLLQENGPYTGQVHILDIGLAPAYYESTETNYFFVDDAIVRSYYRPRNRFAHKGSFGHALLAAGSYGKMGAAQMAALACLRGGAGLLTCHVPRCGVAVLQTALPEAMVLPDSDEQLLANLPPSLDRFSAIGIGPGIGKEDATVELLERYLQHSTSPLVLDADALNILAQHPLWLQRLPAGSILTPHPKEFDRLFGEHRSDFDRIGTALAQASRLQSVVLVKGHHTFIATPEGHGYFNSTGNAGMAKGGSGDVLTGLLTSLLAQGYTGVQAAVLGVWLHGKAGDIAVSSQSYESLLPTDLVACLGAAFRSLCQDVQLHIHPFLGISTVTPAG
jgi:hydroxyethylthiazole kinase-like uncharacterized protein yjeF